MVRIQNPTLPPTPRLIFNIGQFPGPTIEADWGDTIRKLDLMSRSHIFWYVGLHF